MIDPNPVPPEKDRTWVWVLSVVGVLCLCFVLAAAAGGFFYIRRYGLALPKLPTAAPTNPSSSSNPSKTAVPLTVVPYDPSAGNLPGLQQLAQGYQGAMQPSVHTWPITIPNTQPVVILMGWCTVDQATLEQNYQHLTWVLTLDGKNTPLSSLAQYDTTETDQTGRLMYCRNYIGVINTWPPGTHQISTTMRLDQPVNDGWNLYPSGDYTDVYQVTVSQPGPNGLEMDSAGTIPAAN